MTLPIALQLYTVREPLAQDFEGTLKAVANIGYQNVELAGLGGKSAQEVRAILDRLGLRAISSHVGIDAFQGDLSQVIEDAKTLGYQYVVCPFLPDAYRTAEGYLKAASILNQAGQKLNETGLSVGYHNHSFEFEKIDGGQRGMDLLFEHAEADTVFSELDVYWVQHGHDDPLAWMDKLNGRVPLLHIKDMEKGEGRGFAEVGTGIVDIGGVVKKAPSVGSRYLIIEQDSNWSGSPLDSARTSYQNLVKIIGK